MQLARFPRIRLAHLPTPLEPLDRLSAALGGPEIWIKRDDCTGLSTGGNKTRKLEFLMAEAVAQGADVVLTQGATQSNHARQTAAFAARLGIDCHILLENRTGSNDPNYNVNGNVFLDHLHGATMERCPGGSNPTGALGYVDAAFELVRQADGIGLSIDHLIHATGSAGTQAGLVVGLKAVNAGIPLLGIGVRAERKTQEENVYRLALATADTLGQPNLVKREDVVADTSYVGPGYGLPTPGMIEAVEMFARLEGILLDPVYSGKGAAGLIDLVRKGRFKKDEKVVFLHTGGSAALFGYTAVFGEPASVAA